MEQGHYRTTGTRGKGKVWSIERRIGEVAARFLICPRDRSTSLLNPSFCSLPTSLPLLSLWSGLQAAWREIVLSEPRRDIIMCLHNSHDMIHCIMVGGAIDVLLELQVPTREYFHAMTQNIRFSLYL
jgi:hypothetical protein